MEQQGHTLSSIVISSSLTKADSACSTALKMPLNAEVHRLVRIRLVDGKTTGHRNHGSPRRHRPRPSRQGRLRP
ncbi:UTRA domain-containing protein [uncultured Cohaesibacter sp.]|uniref:UTRA domain-containing protein n=1 Tax=uncultured Cohaesibacter sp. TaxID=1002546 RepID=UPI00374899E9